MAGMGDTPKLNARERAKARRAKKDAVNEGVAEVIDLMPADRREGKPRRKHVPLPGKMSEWKRGVNTTVEPGEDNRPNVRITLGKRWSQIVMDVRGGKYTWEEFCEDLDAEELARAQLKDRKGGWQGRPPAMVPREFHLQCQRELRRRFDEKMQSRLLAATDEYIDLSRNVDDAGLREKMLRYVMERVMGPIPKTVELSAAPKHEQFLASVFRAGGSSDYSGRYDRRTKEVDDEGEDEE